jgi:hypothetical protein
MNYQQELIAEKKEKEELLNRVSLLEKEVKKIRKFNKEIHEFIMYLKSNTTKLC